MASPNSIPADLLERCRAALECAWPGLRVLRFDVSVMHWDCSPANFDLAGEVMIFCKVSGSEATLVEHGILTGDDLASVPPCGVCHRRGRTIHRGKTRTRVQISGGDSLSCYWPDKARLAPETPQEEIAGLIAATLVPSLWYRPAQPA